MKVGRRLGRLAHFRHVFRRATGGERIGQAYRLILLISAALAVDFAFPGRTAPRLPVLAEGSIAEEDIVASVDFSVLKPEADLSRQREEAASAVSPIFDLLPEVADSAIGDAATFFEAVELAASAEPGAAAGPVHAARVRQVLERYRIAVSDSQVALLLSTDSRRRLAASIAWSFRNLLRRGAAASIELGPSAAGGIVLRADDTETLVARDSVPTMGEFYERAAARAPPEGGVVALRVYQNLIIRLSQPTIRLNRLATEGSRAQARQAVDPVKAHWPRGEIIIPAGTLVGPDEMERLRAYETEVAQGNGGVAWDTRLGSMGFNLLLALVFGLVLKYFRPGVYASNRSVTLLWALMLIVVGLAAVIAKTGAPTELIPVAFAALLIATLYDGVLAILAVFVLVALVAGRPPLLAMPVLFYTTLGGAAAALSGRVVRRRVHSWAFAAVIAGAYVLAAFTIALMQRLGAGWFALSALWGTVNGVGSTMLATGVLPIAESFTRITTDQSLLELADLNRPLLRRVSLEAPGTYAHSLNVANLAEAAAREIGANSLLARVGVYYHDIGKVKKPEYFVENQRPGRNPHDKLKPATSASIVREHVEAGLEMAEEARLPDVVKAFITEHHGTQRIGFFWEKAQELEPGADLDIKQFTYAGPKPQSKETAIVLLADSVESAARAMQDPTPDSIRELVDRIVGFKLSEGQLARAPLTMLEISLIMEQFVKVLSGMYHHRIDYPAPDTQAARAERAAAPGSP